MNGLEHIPAIIALLAFMICGSGLYMSVQWFPSEKNKSYLVIGLWLSGTIVSCILFINLL